MRKETLEKRLYTRTHATNYIAHPKLQALEGHLGVSLLMGCTPLERSSSVPLHTRKTLCYSNIRKTLCNSIIQENPRCGACHDAKRNAREPLVYAYPCHQPYSTPKTIGPRGTSWRVATSGVHASKAFLERYSRHGGNYWTERQVEAEVRLTNLLDHVRKKN